MVSLLTILVGVVLHSNIVFVIIVRGNIVWGLLDGNVALDDRVVFGIIVRVNIVWGLFDGNISASGIIVRGNIVWGLFDGNNSASWNIGRVHKSLFGSLYPVKITFPLYTT